MFEILLESILQKYLGSYFKNLDSAKLSVGVWNGKIIFENLSLSNLFFSKYSLPFKILYSNVSRLLINIPWNKLSSCPVEIFIEGVDILLSTKNFCTCEDNFDKTVCKKCENVADDEENAFFLKIDQLENFVENYKSTLLRQKSMVVEGEKMKEKSLIQSLMLKILDNIQISIKNINFRMENKLPKDHEVFCLDIKLDYLEIYNTDASNSKTFIDRSKNNEGLHKLFNLKNFDIYWKIILDQNFNAEKSIENFLREVEERKGRQESPKSPKKQQSYFYFFKRTDPNNDENICEIPEDNKEHDKENGSRRILSFTCQIQLFHRNKLTKDEEFEIKSNMGKIEIDLEKAFLVKILRIFELVALYRKRQKKRRVEQINDKSNNEEKFKEFYFQIMKSKERTLLSLSLKDQINYSNILNVVPIENLCEWSKPVIQKVCKEEHEEQEKRKGNWSGWFWNKSNLLNEEEEKRIEAFFEEYDFNCSTKRNSSDSIRYLFNFNLEGGELILRNEKEKSIYSAFISYEGLKGILVFSKLMKNFQLTLQKFKIDLISNFKTKTQKNVNILQNREKLNEIEPLVKMSFGNDEPSNSLQIRKVSSSTQFHSPRKNLDESDAKYLEHDSLKKEAFLNDNPQQYSFNLRISGSTIVYSPIFFTTILKFFKLKIENKEIKGDALETYHELGNKTQETIKENMFDLNQLKINVFLDCPIIKIPFGATPEAWIINLGVLQIQSRNIKDPGFTLPKQSFKLNLKNVRMDYESKNESEKFNLIEDFEIKIYLSMLSKREKEINQNQPKISIEIKIPSFRLAASKKIFNKLFQIQSALFWEDLIDSEQEEKNTILENSKKIGKIYKRGLFGMNIWKDYIAVLSDNYLYFFANQNDIAPDSYFYIKNCIIDDSITASSENSFKIESLSGSLFLNTENNNEKISWIEALRKYCKSKSANTISKINISEVKENLPIVSMNFEIYSVTILLLCDLDKRLEGRFNKLNVIYKKNTSSSYIESNLNSIEINEIKDEKQANILKSQYYLFEEETNNSKKELIQLEIKNLNENCSLYKNIDMEIYFYLGTLELNYNRDTFLTILNFFERKKVISERNSLHKEEKGNNLIQDSFNVSLNENDSDLKLMEKTGHKIANSKSFPYNIDQKTFEEKISKNKNRICFSLVLQKISSIFFNKKTSQPFFELKLKKTELKFYQTDFGQYLFGRLGNLQIIDLSGYKNGPKEMEILGLQNEMDSLFTIKIEKENKNSFIKCQLSGVKLDLGLQQIERIFLYCVHQILDKIKLKTDLPPHESIRISDASEPENNQKFYFEIEEPFIILKPSFLDKEYLVFNLGKIIIQNFEENKKQTKNTFITMENMNIKQIKEDVSIERTQNFDLKINLIRTESKSSAIDFFVKPIKILIDNNFVKLTNEILNENILFDDGKFEIYDFKESNPNEKIKENKLHREIHAEFENIALFFFDSSSKFKHPFCNIFFSNLKILMNINDKKLLFNFVANSLDSSIYILKNDILIEETLIGIQQKEIIYDKNKMDFDKEILWELKGFSKSDLETNKLFNLEWKESENKNEISIDLQNLHLNIHFEILEDFKKLISGFNLNLRKNPLKASETKLKKSFMLTMNIVNPLIALKCHKEKYRLIATGDLHFFISSSPFNNILEETLLSYAKINLNHIEVFLCSLDDFTRKEFNETQKRKIITPFSIEIIKEKFLYPSAAKELNLLNKDKKDFSLRKRIMIKGGDFYAFISYQDVLLLQKTFETKIKNLNIKSSNYQISPELIDTLVITHGNSIRLVFINDFDRSYTPLIDLNLKKLDSLINISLNRFNLTISFEQFNSNYFNFLVNRWEPFVENLALLMDLTKEKNFIEINFEQKNNNNPVNFNMSNQMINLLTKAFFNIKNDLRREEKQRPEKNEDIKNSFLVNSSQSFDNSAYFENYKKQKISFYSIRNLTGYTLEITDEENHNRRIVERNYTINYFFESDSEFLYSDKKAKNKKINIFFPNSLIKFQPLVGLDLDHLRIKQYRIYQYKNPLAYFNILGKLELHPETNRKLFTLYSPFSIWNQLDRIIQLKFILNSNDIKEEPIITLASGEIMELPVDLTNSSFRLKTEDNKIWSELLNCFKDLRINNISIGEFKISMVEEKNSENLRTTFAIHPLCKIINLLPVCLNMKAFFNNKALFKEIILNEKQSYYLYQDNFSGFLITIDHFSSDIIEIIDLKSLENLSKSNKESKQVIILKNEREDFIEINFIYIIKENRIFLMITPIKYIANLTKLPLKFYQPGPFSNREYPIINENKVFLNDCKQVLIFENEIDLRSKMNYTIKIKEHEHDILVENFELTYEDIHFANMVTVNPQHIFLSLLDEEILIRELDQKEEIKLTKEKPINLLWKKTRHFQIKKFDSDWSGKLLITSQNFLLRSSKGSFFFKTTLDGPYLAFHATPPPFLLINNLSEINIHYNQKGIPSKNEILKSYEHIFFGWDEPSLYPELHLTFIKKKKILGAGIINLGIITPKQVLSFENGLVFYKCEVGEETISFSFESFINDKENPENITGREIPSLNLNEKFIENRKKKKEFAMNLKISLKITSLGISFINNLRSPFCEIGYFSIKEFEIAYLRENDENETIQIKLSNAELDNSTSYWTNYPIVFIAKFNEKNFKQPLLTVLIKKKLTKQKIHILEKLLIDLQDFKLNIEEKFLKNIQFYINNILSQIKSTQKKEEKIGIPINSFQNCHEDSFFNVNYHLISPVKTKVFIEEFSIYPFTIYFGYKTQVAKSKDAGKMFGNLFNTVLKNMDNVPIKLKGYEIKYYNDNLSSFLPLILKVFKEKMKSEVLQIIGSAPLIGDPRGFFLNVSNGVKDLIEKPQQGFNKGPLEGGVGLIEGVSSLMANTLVGTINSIDKFSGSIGSGIAALSQDEEFLMEREKLRISRPENLLQGIQQAGESIYKSIGLGFTKIFTSPISGAQKSGISGFIKGAFTGLTGLFLHPITGIVDGASKTAEGLKNSVIFKAGEGRARKIRVFYEFEQYFTTFNEEDSSMMEYLRIYKKGKFENLFFKKGVLLEKESCLLIFTMQKTLLMRIKNGKKVWSFNNEDFDRVENYSDGVRIGLKKKMKETEDYHLFISTSSEVKQEEISQTLNEIAFNLKEKQ